MTTVFPVHPDDVEQLLVIRRYLIGYRITNGWTQMDLSMKINGTKGMVWDLESSTTWQWRLSRLQEWTMPFGLMLEAQVCFPGNLELWQKVSEHPEVQPLLSLSLKKDGAWPMWQRAYIGAALSAARRLQHISSDAMGKRLGISGNAVRSWESSRDEMMLPKVLHYARALDGIVTLTVPR